MNTLSLQEKISLISELTDDDLTEWEAGFIRTVVRHANAAVQAGQVTKFSEKQLYVIEELHLKHFG